VQSLICTDRKTNQSSLRTPIPFFAGGRKHNYVHFDQYADQFYATRPGRLSAEMHLQWVHPVLVHAPIFFPNLPDAGVRLLWVRLVLVPALTSSLNLPNTGKDLQWARPVLIHAPIFFPDLPDARVHLLWARPVLVPALTPPLNLPNAGMHPLWVRPFLVLLMYLGQTRLSQLLCPAAQSPAGSPRLRNLAFIRLTGLKFLHQQRLYSDSTSIRTSPFLSVVIVTVLRRPMGSLSKPSTATSLKIQMPRMTKVGVVSLFYLVLLQLEPMFFVSGEREQL
jgi:hypothetical protein